MSSHLNGVWEEWELRVLVLLSLTIQLLLIFLGHERKYQPGAWLRVVVWSCYLVADADAIYALGKIGTRINQMHHYNTKGLDPDARIAAFWAPFLLLHLGGPDTITAYALEDNELWLRHFLTLIIQTAMTLYIFFQALADSDLRLLSLLMIASGLIKYGERIHVLWAASSNQFRDSIPDPPLNYSKIQEEYALKKAEGYNITAHKVVEVSKLNTKQNPDADKKFSHPDEDLLSEELKKKLKQGTEKSNWGQSLLAIPRSMFDFLRRFFGDINLLPEGIRRRNRAELAVAKDLIKIFRRLFADLVLSHQERDTSLSLLKDKHYHVVYRVIEIELGIMFDLLYTKAMAFHKRRGFVLRIMSILSTVTVLPCWCFFPCPHHEYTSKMSFSPLI